MAAPNALSGEKGKPGDSRPSPTLLTATPRLRISEARACFDL